MSSRLIDLDTTDPVAVPRDIETAEATATQAKEIAVDARTRADIAMTQADNAREVAVAAEEYAHDANGKANEADTKASVAEENAHDANNRASAAEETAHDADDKANSAISAANAANDRASAAEVYAHVASDKAQEAIDKVSVAITAATEALEKANTVLGMVSVMHVPRLEELEYVTFDGTQYVDLGFKANQGTIKIDFVITPQTLSPWPSGANQTYHALLGSRYNTVGSSPSGRICNAFLARNGALRPDMVCGKAYDPPIPMSLGETYRVILERGAVIVDGVYTDTTVPTTTGPQEDQGVSFFLGYLNEEVPSGVIFAKYCGYWGPTKIYQSGVLFMDLVPVRVENDTNTGYFYDKISKKLFGGAKPAYPLIAGPKKSNGYTTGMAYDFGTDAGVKSALRDVVAALGGSAISMQ